MKIDFEVAYNITAKNEGGYVIEDGDTGGETYSGISRVNHPKWAGWQIVDANKPLTKGQFIKDPVLKGMVKEFYRKNFWLPLSPDKLPSQDLANQAYDQAVNGGVSTAKRMLKAIGIFVTMIMLSTVVLSQSVKPVKNICISEVQYKKLVRERDSLFIVTKSQGFRLERIKFYADIANRKPSQRKFFLGWVNRAIK
jgi:hypothetical protein